jgi:hypothetical protein
MWRELKSAKREEGRFVLSGKRGFDERERRGCGVNGEQCGGSD